MPLYEYQCDACGHRFEVIQKFSDPPVEACPTCGKPVRKLLSSPAIQFKGSGWYITDYARKGGTESSKSDGSKETRPKTDAPARSEGAGDTKTSTPDPASGGGSSTPAKPAS